MDSSKLLPFPTQLYKGTVTLSQPIEVPDRGKVLPILETPPFVSKEKLLAILYDLLARGVICGSRVSFGTLRRLELTKPGERTPISWYHDKEVIYSDEHALRVCGDAKAVYSGVVHGPTITLFKAHCYLPTEALPDEDDVTVRYLFTARSTSQEATVALADQLYRLKLIAGYRLLSSEDGVIWEGTGALPPCDDFDRFRPMVTHAEDQHAATAAWIYGVPYNAITPGQRWTGKTLNLTAPYA